MAVQREYPQAEKLQLPQNIDSEESTRFSPLRNRDITSSAISVHNEIEIDVTLDQKPETESIQFNDVHLSCYDNSGAVNLASVMQTSVPEPYGFTTSNKFSHLNMPGGSMNCFF